MAPAARLRRTPRNPPSTRIAFEGAHQCCILTPGAAHGVRAAIAPWAPGARDAQDWVGSGLFV